MSEHVTKVHSNEVCSPRLLNLVSEDELHLQNQRRSDFHRNLYKWQALWGNPTVSSPLWECTLEHGASDDAGRTCIAALSVTASLFVYFRSQRNLLFGFCIPKFLLITVAPFFTFSCGRYPFFKCRILVSSFRQQANRRKIWLWRWFPTWFLLLRPYVDRC